MPPSFASQLSARAQLVEARTRSREYAQMAVLRALAGESGTLGAAAMARGRGASQRVIEALQRSAVPPMSTSNTGELLAVDEHAEAFTTTLRNGSAFETILGDGGWREIPARTRIRTVTLAPTASAVAEGAFKPLTSMSFRDDGIFDLVKATSTIVITDELLRHNAAPGILEAEALAALGAEIDAIVFNEILESGVPSQASAGTSGANALTDIGWLLSQVVTGKSSRLYFVGSPSVIKALSVRNGAGIITFAQLTPSGGLIQGVPTLVSDGVASGVLVLLDAKRFYAAVDGPAQLVQARHAAIAMDSQPDENTPLYSLWQENKIAIRAERYFGITPPPLSDAYAIAYVTGIV